MEAALLKMATLGGKMSDQQGGVMLGILGSYRNLRRLPHRFIHKNAGAGPFACL